MNPAMPPPENMPSVIIDGKERFLGNNMPMKKPDKHVKFKGVYGDFPNQPMLLRNQWRPMSMRKHVKEIQDQDGIGACNAFCTIMCAMIVRSIMGLPWRLLSAGWLYGNINGQQDNGSMLDEALKWMNTNGTPYATTVGMLEWRKSQWKNPQAIAAEAKSNMILEAYWCPTFDHLASAVQSYYPCNTGIWWGDADSVDSNGWLNSGARGRRGGHSIPAIGIKERAGRWGYETANSWGVDWADNGFAMIPESRVTSDGMSSGMWAVCAVKADAPDDLPELKEPAKAEEPKK